MGVQGVFGGCSDEVFMPHGTYHMIINTIIGIAMMTLCDLCLSQERSSDMANKRLREAWALYKQGVDNFLNTKAANPIFVDESLNSKLLSVGSSCVQANMEPRWWRTPWKERLMSDTVSCGFRLQEHLCNMRSAGTIIGKHGEVH